MNIRLKKFEQFIKQEYNIPRKEMDDFFASLEAVTIEEMIGEWKVGYLFTKEETGSKWETFIKKFSIVRLYSKKFIDQNNVQAWIYRFFGIKISILGASAILRNIEFRGKISTSMVYNYMPMIDNFRKVGDDMIMGIMEVKGEVSVYFCLKKLK